MEMDSNILTYQSIQWQMNAAAPTSLWSKESQKTVLRIAFLHCFSAVMVIPANENICKNLWVRMSFCFYIAKPNQKQLHAPQREESTCSCVNLNILDAAYKEERRDMDGNLSRENVKREWAGWPHNYVGEVGIPGKRTGIKCLLFPFQIELAVWLI